MTTTSGSVYYHHDGLGNTIAITNGNADVLERYSYDVFGLVNVVDASTGNAIPQSAHGVRHFYTGHDFQAELGLYLTHYRAYEPVLGRWLSADPIGEAGGINLYGYVSNNPVNWVDPLGLFNPSKGLSSLGNAANAGRLYARGALKLAGAAGLTATGAGAPVGAGAAALGGWNIWSGQSAWNRSMQQWNEALNEDWSDASWKNLLGVLPFGTEFDDPCEPSPWEVLKDKAKDFKDKPWEFMQEIGTWGF
jgi:type VI secretion system secreted protein VgrG